MKARQRFFGGGPMGLALNIGLLWAAFRLQPLLGTQAIHGNREAGVLIFAIFSVLSGALLLWSLVSLPPWSRGTRVATGGVYKYLRHPLYSSFILLAFGLAVWLDNWIFVAWAAVQFPVWHLSARGEESLMSLDFPEYQQYCRHTPRFIPRLWSRS